VLRVISRQRVVVSRIGVDDADVGHRGLGQNTRHVARREGGLEGRDVVELDDARRDRRVDGWADVVLPGPATTVLQGNEGLVDGAVVAPVEDEISLPARDLPRQSDGEPVGVRGAHGDLPARQPEARVSSSPTGIASSVGSMKVIPRRTWLTIASTAASGAWPVMAPVSPRQKSRYS